MIHVAIDGPAGAGKSTIAKMLANRLGIEYLDTGAMYRAVTAMAIDRGVSLDDPLKLEALALSLSDEGKKCEGSCSSLGLPDARLREEDVSTSVSKVATYTPVRRALVQLQRLLATQRSLVVDGRDIGTVVLPDAKVKVYLDASPEERARRRSQQNGLEFQKVLHDIKERDLFDSTRKDSPLRKAEDAHYIDSSFMTPDEVVNEILSLIETHVYLCQ